MRYMLMICDDESVQPGPAELAADPEFVRWRLELDCRGTRRGGARLRPSCDATTVRVRGGEVLLSDGPFAESAERIGGFDLIECADLDEAIEVAAAHPYAASGSVEVRPVWDA